MSQTVNVYYQPLEEISTVIRNQLIKLNNRWNGRMIDHLLSRTQTPIKDAVVFYALSPDGRVASWAMVYKDRNWQDTRWDIVVDFYTKKSERNKGYASCVADAIRKVYPNKRMHGEYRNSTIFKRFRIH